MEKDVRRDRHFAGGDRVDDFLKLVVSFLKFVFLTLGEIQMLFGIVYVRRALPANRLHVEIPRIMRVVTVAVITFCLNTCRTGFDIA